MNNTLTDKYIILDMVQVSQLQSGIVFTGKMKFNQLNQIYKLTERKESIDDPFGNSKITFEKNSNNEFQRQLSQQKLVAIESYLREEMLQREAGKSLAMFPSSLILYNRAYEPDDLKIENDLIENAISTDIINESYSETLDCCFYLPTEDKPDLYQLFIPKNKGITLIVDGQHRFIGTQRYYKSLNEADKKLVEIFEFIVTFLVGFDLYEVGQIFATVNFNQKPVNRSLYYDIFGSAPQTDRDGKVQNDIRLAHDLALHLSNNETSPIQSMIKLLGKGYGLFSQAFFVDKMIRYVFKSKIWDAYITDYLSGGNEYRVIAEFIKAYLAAIKEAYPSAWPSKIYKNNMLVYSSYDYKYILCKTTGLGAYFRLIKDIYPLVASEPESFQQNIYKIFNKMEDAEANNLFAKTGDFGGAGSEGLQDKLYKYLLKKYNLL